MHIPTSLLPLLTLSTLLIPALATCSPTNQTSACLCTPAQPATKFPNKCEISKVFAHLAEGNFTAFLDQVTPDVQWTLMGTHALAGVYHNRTIFAVDALARLANTLDPAHKGSMKLTYIVGGGEEEWSVQELHGQGVCKNGLVYDNKFAWVTRWTEQGKIAECRGYLDSALVQRAITENESGEYTYTDQRLTMKRGPVGAGCAVES
ncbi:hypothetical protein BU16DRAFT_567193 [Lophium mytilinum]|uniref:SnoaL-like domain-containing protein n=1 Tax=Lophium mytilinum TaxID=390894 RepID=A0A6A6QDC4_9PEZI|nr:hypothetical protein BU16DRAFT_567193 [Lophium mytilinum]